MQPLTKDEAGNNVTERGSSYLQKLITLVHEWEHYVSMDDTSTAQECEREVKQDHDGEVEIQEETETAGVVPEREGQWKCPTGALQLGSVSQVAASQGIQVSSCKVGLIDSLRGLLLAGSAKIMCLV